jgi:tetratricopeptide (TPR) repeat protein
MSRKQRAATSPAFPVAPAPADVVALFAIAAERHNSGRLEEAVGLYDFALRLWPGRADAHANRSVALNGLRRFEEARAACDAAIRLEPELFEAHYNRAHAEIGLGRPEAGLADLDRALRIRPRSVEAHCDRSVMLQSLGEPEKALAACDLALRIRPDFLIAHNNRAAALQALGRWGESLAACEAALRLSPSSFAANANRAEAFWRLGCFDEALVAADAAITIAPDAAEGQMHRGNALGGLGRSAESLAAYDAAIRLRPRFARAHANRGAALMDLGETRAALAAFDEAARLDPKDALTHSNRSAALMDLGDPEASLNASEAALALEPRHGGALNNHANALKELARFDEAEAVFAAAASANPSDSKIAYNCSLLHLLRGDFAAGWPGYESRWDVKGAPARRLQAPFPVWRREDLAGKSIIVYDEQGYGDAIQFARYLTPLLDLGARVTVLARQNLWRLLGSVDRRLSFVAACPCEAEFDYQSALLSLPATLGVTLTTMVAEPAYLSADPARVRTWGERLGAHGFRVGIAWQGHRSKIDIGRSFPLAELSGLSKAPGVRLVSLQKNKGVEQLRDLPEGMIVETLGDDFDAGPDAFLDAAAVIENLDLVITSDTAIAHLAGALGRPVWVALRHVPDWRWLTNRADSPWYPSMRLFRQRERGRWKGVFGAMERALRERAGAGGAVLAPGSP